MWKDRLYVQAKPLSQKQPSYIPAYGMRLWWMRRSDRRGRQTWSEKGSWQFQLQGLCFIYSRECRSLSGIIGRYMSEDIPEMFLDDNLEIVHDFIQLISLLYINA
jgi:hypothetical protein